MPFLVPLDDIGTQVILVLAFGTPSHLEAACLLGDSARVTRQRDDIATVSITEKTRTLKACQRLAGIHKLAVPLPSPSSPDFIESIDFPSRNFNFSLSLYGPSGNLGEEYDQLCDELLSAIREGGLKKANLIRSHAISGVDLHAEKVISRSAMDFIAYRDAHDGYQWGITVYVPDTASYRERSTGRPFTTSEISLSPRLARLLVNMSGVAKGQLMLDPFCGSGTILGEALLAGIDCIGLDRSRNRTELTKKNLAWILARTGEHGIPPRGPSYSVEVGDATNIEKSMKGRLLDAVVSEPILMPRISSALTLEKARKLVRNSSRLYSEAIYSIAGAVRKGGRVVIVTPSLKTLEGREVSVALENLEEAGLDFFQPAGYDFKYPMRVEHQSTRWITRMVYVLQKRA